MKLLFVKPCLYVLSSLAAITVFLVAAFNKLAALTPFYSHLYHFRLWVFGSFQDSEQVMPPLVYLPGASNFLGRWGLNLFDSVASAGKSKTINRNKYTEYSGMPQKEMMNGARLVVCNGLNSFCKSDQ